MSTAPAELDLLLESARGDPRPLHPRALDDLAARRAPPSQPGVSPTARWSPSHPAPPRAGGGGHRRAQPDLAVEVTGPPARAAYGADGALTKAGAGFAKGRVSTRGSFSSR